MKRMPLLFGIYARPPRKLALLLAVLPFVLVLAGYLWASYVRHETNPRDKLLPTPTEIVAAVKRVAFTQSKRTGSYPMAADTLASLKRLFLGVTLAAAVGLLLGLNIGLFPGFRSLLLPFVTFYSMIPPLAILPILFISFGVDELAKVMLIFLGIFPVITRDIYLAVSRIPTQQMTKAFTLGASQLAIAYRIVLPQIVPRLIDAVRLSLGPAWLFLIAAEAIAANDGLGYRIFLVRRYLDMAVILPYVLWITLLGFLIDWLLKTLLERRYAWYLGRSNQ